MDKIVIAISNSGNDNKPATQEQKDSAYKEAVDKFSNSKEDVPVDTLRKILKAISTLLEYKENDATGIDTNFHEQTDVKNKASDLFT